MVGLDELRARLRATPLKKERRTPIEAAPVVDPKNGTFTSESFRLGETRAQFQVSYSLNRHAAISLVAGGEVETKASPHFHDLFENYRAINEPRRVAHALKVLHTFDHAKLPHFNLMVMAQERSPFRFSSDFELLSPIWSVPTDRAICVNGNPVWVDALIETLWEASRHYTWIVHYNCKENEEVPAYVLEEEQKWAQNRRIELMTQYGARLANAEFEDFGKIGDPDIEPTAPAWGAPFSLNTEDA